jgi:hypothetical protein
MCGSVYKIFMYRSECCVRFDGCVHVFLRAYACLGYEGCYE